MSTVGLIGLGLVGQALAGRFLAGGMHVIGYDVRPPARESLAAQGGTVAASTPDVFHASDRILLSLPTTDVVESVLGEVDACLAGKTIIDTTTGDPQRVAELGRRLAEREVHYLDATIGGSSTQVRAGDVIVMIGGDAAVFQSCEPLFPLFARRWFFLGSWGSGARMKLVLNLVLGLNRAVLAEGLSLARRLELDAETVLDVLRAGPAWSRVMETKGPRMIAGDFAPEARLSQHLKDVRLILAAGAQTGARLPFSTLHETLLEQLERAGHGEADNSVVIRAFEPE